MEQLLRLRPPLCLRVPDPVRNRSPRRGRSQDLRPGAAKPVVVRAPSPPSRLRSISKKCLATSTLLRSMAPETGAQRVQNAHFHTGSSCRRLSLKQLNGLPAPHLPPDEKEMVRAKRRRLGLLRLGQGDARSPSTVTSSSRKPAASTETTASSLISQRPNMTRSLQR